MHLCSDVKWSFQSQLDLIRVQLKWTGETKLLFCFPSYFVTSRLSKSISSIHSYEFLNRSCIVPHVFSGWTENYFSSKWKVNFFFARDKYWLFTSCQDGTDPSRLEQQQKHLPCVRMDRVASSILIPKFFWKKTTIEGCYADVCSVLGREAEQFIYCRWFCN